MKTNKLELKGFVSTYKYNADGTLKSETAVKGSGKKKETVKTTYSYKNGLVSRIINKIDGYKYVYDYTYDKKKNLKKWEAAPSSDYYECHTYKNTYENGLLTKRYDEWSAEGDNGGKITYVYVYKKMTVNKSLADKIKTQQWSIINDNLNNAVPFNNYDGM